jgi:hypothetical protein
VLTDNTRPIWHGEKAAFSPPDLGTCGTNLIHDAGSWLDHGLLASPTFMVWMDARSQQA